MNQLYVKIETVFLVLMGIFILIFIPNLFFYTNYLKSTIGKTYSIDLTRKSIAEVIRNKETLYDFKNIESIKQYRHLSYKPFKGSKNFWDRLENRLEKKQDKNTIWHKFSYTIIYFKDSNPIILTSLMSNYNKLPFNNIEITYVKKPLIKKA